MKIDEILALTKQQQINLLSDEGKKGYKKWQDEYNGEHKIKKDQSRQPYSITRNGRKELVYPAIIILKLQKKIVKFAVQFLFGKSFNLILNDKEQQKPFEEMKKILRDNKIEYFDRDLCEKVKTECLAAELWTPKLDKKGDISGLRVSLLSRSNGDKISANFDETGDMDAFCRHYEVDVLEDVRKSKEERFEIHTADKTYRYVKKGNMWGDAEGFPLNNPTGKINAVLYEQDEPDWSDVQLLIDRLELMLSRLSDKNDYFSGPILKTWGQIKGDLPDKERDSKVLQFEEFFDPETGKETRGDADYLVWEQSSESVKLEMDTLLKQIHSISSTPDVSFENVKGIGNVTGIALRLLFTEAVNKARDSLKIFGEGYRRRTKIISAYLNLINKSGELDVTPEWQNPLPEDMQYLMGWLTEATGGKQIMSVERAVGEIPGQVNQEEELKRIKAESVTEYADSVRF